ncbi:MAG: M48 family metallopeptidase [Chthoniobacterales bacterium]|nr:M48 family metallopeptidase [Chthoniobacterales bacterium]
MGADFFELQEKARKKTKLLIFLIGLAVISIIIAFYGFFLIFSQGPIWQPELFFAIAIVVLLIVFSGCFYKISQLSKGGKAVAEMLGGFQILPDTVDFLERRLLNIVEEMAIASGCPIPEVYVLPKESGINAFAAGRTPNDAVIGVTRGAIEKLERDELQGVIAHEFSHILNGDMRLNLHLIGIIFGIFCVSEIGRILIRLSLTGEESRTRFDRNFKNYSIGVFIIGLTTYIIGFLGVFFGRLIQAAINRQREYLADAAAVQFTRNPYGIASALYKILLSSSSIINLRSQEAAHLFFGKSLSSIWGGIFSTHPSIKSRIRAIAPDFYQMIVTDRNATSKKFVPKIESKSTAEEGTPGFNETTTAQQTKTLAVDKLRWLESAGQLNPIQLNKSIEILDSLLSEFQEGIRNSEQVQILVYALLLSQDQQLYQRQLQILELPSESISLLRILSQQIQSLDFQQRIVLLELTIPTLRSLSFASQNSFFKKTLRLIEADNQTDLFEFFIQKILECRLQPDQKIVHKESPNILPYLRQISLLLGALANQSSNDAEARRKAYQAGIRELLVNPSDPALTQPQEVTLTDLNAALDALSMASLSIKRRILTACGAVVLEDKTLRDKEAQYLRAIAAVFGCPVPPFVELPQPGFVTN